jgi:hypothetical protein
MNPFNSITISSAELEYVRELDPADRIMYLFELYDIERARQKNPNMNLTQFFDEILDTEENSFQSDSYDAGDSTGDQHRVDVMIDEQNIIIESNSLKAVRIIKHRFIENGFILQRDKETEKMFKKDKMTRYFRVFIIVNQIDPICYN